MMRHAASALALVGALLVGASPASAVAGPAVVATPASASAISFTSAASASSAASSMSDPQTVVAATPSPAATALRAAVGRLVPAGSDARHTALLDEAGVDDSPLRHSLDRAIDGSIYQCSATDFDRWIQARLADFTDEERQALREAHVFDLPLEEAIYYGRRGDSRYALTSYATVMSTTFNRVRQFSDIRSDGVDLFAAHGSMLLDRSRVARIYRIVEGLDAAAADDLAGRVVDLVRSSPRFRGGNHPLFSLNAFSYTGFGQPEPVVGLLSNRIIVGDGILEANRDLGYGDTAARVIVAHEFGHQVQFAIKMITADTVDSPETSRRIELHADAFSGYFLGHVLGGSMGWVRAQAYLPVYYSIGDCRFDDDYHHGTPNQRMRAAVWAYQLQADTRPITYIHSSLEFLRRFDAALPSIVAADA